MNLGFFDSRGLGCPDDGSRHNKHWPAPNHVARNARGFATGLKIVLQLPNFNVNCQSRHPVSHRAVVTVYQKMTQNCFIYNPLTNTQRKIRLVPYKSGMRQNVRLRRILFSMFTLQHSRLKLLFQDMAQRLNSIYRPLTKAQREIRLVHLVPQSKNAANSETQTLIHCSLSHASLDGRSKPIYTALSYTWGDPTCTKPIVIEGSVVHVTQTLETALRHLQHDSVPLWIDAICIDQTNVVEKGEQVHMMREIYEVSV